MSQQQAEQATTSHLSGNTMGRSKYKLDQLREEPSAFIMPICKRDPQDAAIKQSVLQAKLAISRQQTSTLLQLAYAFYYLPNRKKSSLSSSLLRPSLLTLSLIFVLCIAFSDRTSIASATTSNLAGANSHIRTRDQRSSGSISDTGSGSSSLHRKEDTFSSSSISLNSDGADKTSGGADSLDSMRSLYKLSRQERQHLRNLIAETSVLHRHAAHKKTQSHIPVLSLDQRKHHARPVQNNRLYHRARYMRAIPFINIPRPFIDRHIGYIPNPILHNRLRGSDQKLFSIFAQDPEFWGDLDHDHRGYHYDEFDDLDSLDDDLDDLDDDTDDENDGDGEGNDESTEKNENDVLTQIDSDGNNAIMSPHYQTDYASGRSSEQQRPSSDSHPMDHQGKTGYARISSHDGHSAGSQPGHRHHKPTLSDEKQLKGVRASPENFIRQREERPLDREPLKTHVRTKEHRLQLHQRRQPPLERGPHQEHVQVPYQSPVVVSISDNSFVSASPPLRIDAKKQHIQNNIELDSITTIKTATTTSNNSHERIDETTPSIVGSNRIPGSVNSIVETSTISLLDSDHDDGIIAHREEHTLEPPIDQSDTFNNREGTRVHPKIETSDRHREHDNDIDTVHLPKDYLTKHDKYRTEAYVATNSYAPPLSISHKTDSGSGSATMPALTILSTGAINAKELAEDKDSDAGDDNNNDVADDNDDDDDIDLNDDDDIDDSNDLNIDSIQYKSNEDPVRYSHIVSSQNNELPSYGRRYWHNPHRASIQMVQEEPNELHQGEINSAIIAILFGIGAMGMLIMIVSVKMGSIRERVAYKGRRRSLVPDTDYLINTIPI